MLDISCLKRWGQELYGSAGRQAPSLSKVTALFLAHRSFMIALGVAFVVGIAWKFYNRTITPLSKIESAQLNRIISTMTADFPSLKTRYTGLSEQILKWEHLKLENPLAPDIQQLFVATFNALSSSPTNGVLVINILTILNAPQPEKKEKVERIQKKIELQREELVVIEKAIEEMSAASFTALMRFLISKEGSREKSSLISPSLAEHFTKALDLIHFVRQKDSDFMKDTLLLAREIQSLREDLQLFSKQHDSIFTKYAKELQQPFLFRRTKEMTPKIRQEMQQNLGTWEKKLSLVIEHLA